MYNKEVKIVIIAHEKEKNDYMNKSADHSNRAVFEDWMTNLCLDIDDEIKEIHGSQKYFAFKKDVHSKDFDEIRQTVFFRILEFKKKRNYASDSYKPILYKYGLLDDNPSDSKGKVLETRTTMIIRRIRSAFHKKPEEPKKTEEKSNLDIFDRAKQNLSDENGK